ncbi:TRAP transporter small permease [Flintibacter sp.]|mgnify:FL=1|uniref:TRAP transporter small permease n=1 Tax=Flintibacter sp. TaxID=1918624 RepID=UPI003A4A43C7
MNPGNKLKNVLCSLDTIVASIVLAILIILTFAGVPFRYILGAPFTWLEEVQLACMVWIVFAAAGAAFRAGNQVAIEMIVDLMPKKMQKAVTVFISVVVLAVVGYLFYQSLGYINVFLKSGRATPMLKIPYALIYGIAPVSYVLMVISYFYALIKGVKSEAKEALDL